MQRMCEVRLNNSESESIKRERVTSKLNIIVVFLKVIPYIEENESIRLYLLIYKSFL